MGMLGVLEMTRYGVLVLLAVISGYTDYRYQKVYNWTTYPAFLVGLLLAAAQATASQNVEFIASPWTFYFADALGGAAFCLFIMGATYLMGGLGFGDVKLMVAAGTLAGFWLSIHILMLSVLTGVAIGVSMIIWKGKVREMIRRSFEFKKVFRRQKLEDSVQPVPFGTAFAGGCLWALALLFINSGGAR
jgi:Flp pilus assembly protein protease CpaA